MSISRFPIRRKDGNEAYNRRITNRTEEEQIMNKRIPLALALIALILAGLTAAVSVTRAQQKQTLFIGLFKAKNPEFAKKGPRPEDMPVVREHLEYFQKLSADGVSLVAGHTLNHDESAFGIAIVRADSESAARKIMDEVPLVRAGLLTVTVFPFEGLIGKGDAASGRQP